MTQSLKYETTCDICGELAVRESNEMPSGWWNYSVVNQHSRHVCWSCCEKVAEHVHREAPAAVVCTECGATTTYQLGGRPDWWHDTKQGRRICPACLPAALKKHEDEIRARHAAHLPDAGPNEASAAIDAVNRLTCDGCNCETAIPNDDGWKTTDDGWICPDCQCPHGEPSTDCDACFRASDHAADVAREQRHFGR